MTDLGTILGLIISLISITTFIGGVLAYQRASARKEYASERDFNHLKNNQVQMSKNVEELWRQSDTRFDHIDLRLTEITMMLGATSPPRPRPPHQIGKDPES